MNRVKTALWLGGAILGVAFLVPAAIAMRAAISELRSGMPTPYAVSRPLTEAWIDSAKDITVSTPKGVVLRGWLVPSANGGGVVFEDGSAADRTQLLPEAHILSAAGYGVFVFDRPGTGESGGQKGREDELDFLRLAVDVLASEPGLRPGGIGAYGFSSGTAFLAEAAAKDTRLQGVVLAGCFTDAEEFVRHFQGRGALKGLPALWANRWAGFVFPHPLARVPEIAPRALFLIAGDRDTVDPPDLSERLYAAASEPKTLWIVHGASHGNYAQVAGQEYAQKLLAFFDRALLGRDAPH
jgi:alpha-beta hydrolase superfamily lysophospholipase